MQILVTKPGTLNQRDKALLRKAGVVAVEAERPEEVRLIQAESVPLTSNDMLYAAMSTIVADKYQGNCRDAFVKVLFSLLPAPSSKGPSDED